ncbi:MAG TPA: hypothetical protein VFW09_02695 [Solirubrobacteraceae bacterium]|nr:hypothetical protein [Solirubrobacteraceae bacterium]
MPTKNTMTSSVRPVNPRRNAIERRAAEIAAAANKQPQLKREAAQRRAERARREAEAPAQPRKNAMMQRRRAR